GYVLQTLARDYGRLVGTVVSAGIFAVLHLMNPGRSVAAFLGIFLAGLYFAAAFLLSGRLYLPIAAHFAWNWLLGPFFGLPVSGVQMPSVLHTTVAGPSAITGGSFGPEAGVLGWIALAINLPLLVLATRRR
ncbi:MAG: CPBP family intramembrane metalloprotease, partial [Armatimonadetes bacterium]|nr:CPBP family intramembrane metalloprotease [Armatimonadota bacterium]